MKYFRYLALAIVTFVIGVAISPIRFSAEMIACGPRSSATSYRSSYFVQTTKSHVTYDSDAEASDAFNEQLSEAITVYDTSPKVNSKGALIEQRAVALFHNQDRNEDYVVSFWRDERTLVAISSRSYIHVKEFEKQNF